MLEDQDACKSVKGLTNIDFKTPHGLAAAAESSESPARGARRASDSDTDETPPATVGPGLWTSAGCGPGG